jgi:hypothetical protein
VASTVTVKPGVLVSWRMVILRLENMGEETWRRARREGRET